MSKRVTRYYQIAGIGYRVTLPAERMYPEELLLEPYGVDCCEADQQIDFYMTDCLTPPEGSPVFSNSYRRVYRSENGCIFYDGDDEGSMRVHRQGGKTRVELLNSAVPYYITTKLVMSAMELSSQLIRHGGFLLHASYISHQGQGILFTAPSGTGKSTQADLWCRHRGARLLNGDRAAVLLEDGQIRVHGVPFCGSSGVSENVTTPLRAIVVLGQAPVTTIAPLRGIRAFRRIWEGCTVNSWDRQEVEACADLVSYIVQNVPVFHLACTPDESAVAALEQAIHDLR